MQREFTFSADSPDTPQSATLPEIPYGYCHCGCGQKTRLHKDSNRTLGIKAGEPRKYVKDHSPRRQHPRSFADALSAISTTGDGDECWECHSNVGPKGYAHIRHGRRKISAHRAAWMAVYGPIPDGLFVCHKCDNPKCVNPSHLFLGTIQDNNADRHNKGRDGVMYGVDHPRSKLDNDKVRKIRELRAQGLPCAKIAAMFGVTECTVSHVAIGRIWNHVP